MTNNDQRDGRIGVNTVLSVIALVLSIISFFLILLLWHSGPQKPDSDVLAISITALEVVLGVLAVLLAIGAFVGFWMIRSSATEAAREEARKKVEELAPELIRQANRISSSEKISGHQGDSNEPKLDITQDQESDVIDQSTPVGDDNQ